MSKACMLHQAKEVTSEGIPVLNPECIIKARYILEIYYIYKHGGQAMLLNLISNITKVVY
jgi:hypothetical protein